MEGHGDRWFAGDPDGSGEPRNPPPLTAAVDEEALYLHERGRPGAYLRAEEPVEIRR